MENFTFGDIEIGDKLLMGERQRRISFPVVEIHKKSNKVSIRKLSGYIYKVNPLKYSALRKSKKKKVKSWKRLIE